MSRVPSKWFRVTSKFKANGLCEDLGTSYIGKKSHLTENIGGLKARRTRRLCTL